MPARHYRSEYVEEGVTILLSADETPGPGITHDLTALGLPQGTHSGKVVLTPLVGGEPVESNSFIHQIGNPTQVEPVTVTSTVAVTLADVVVRRDALLAAAGVEASAADTAAMNEALLVAAGASATVVDNKGIRVFDDVQSSADVTTTLTAAQIMREQLSSVVIAADSVSVMKLMLEQVQAAITASATVTDGALRTDAASVAASVVASVADTYTPGATAPDAPTGVSASNSPAQITVTWGVVSGAASYNVYYNTANNSAGATKISGLSGTSKTINGPLTQGTTYYVWVSAQNAAGEGTLSASASVVAAAVAVVAPVTLSFESVTITDSSGATWEEVIPTAVGMGPVGVITSGVSGISGADGNCLSIKQSVFDNGDEAYNLDTFIRRTMNVGVGTLSLKVRRANNTISGTGYVKIGSTKYDLGVTPLDAFVDKTVTIPAAQTNVVVEIGFQLGSLYADCYIDSVSIPQ